MTFDEFATAHAGQEFKTWAELAADAQACGLSDQDKQEVFRAWRRVWSAAARGVTPNGWDRIKRKGVKGHKRSYQDASTAVEMTAT